MDSAIIGIVGTVVGTIFGGAIGYVTSNRLILKQHRIVAGQKLRVAFLKELSALKNKGKFNAESVRDVLEDAFSKHASAITEFQFSLRGKELAGFTKAWQEYYGYKGNGNDYYLNQYWEFSEKSFSSPDKKTCYSRLNETAYNRIMKILEFTK